VLELANRFWSWFIHPGRSGQGQAIRERSQSVWCCYVFGGVLLRIWVVGALFGIVRLIVLNVA
jgi:hypothetical protein